MQSFEQYLLESQMWNVHNNTYSTNNGWLLTVINIDKSKYLECSLSMTNAILKSDKPLNNRLVYKFVINTSIISKSEFLNQLGELLKGVDTSSLTSEDWKIYHEKKKMSKSMKQLEVVIKEIEKIIG